MTLTTGIHGEQSVAVTNENTAKTMGSGTLDVFATPALVALAEKTCWTSVAEALDEGCGTVGTKLELEHTAPTPVGMTVTCESELVPWRAASWCSRSRSTTRKAPLAAAPTSALSSITPSLRPRPRAKRIKPLSRTSLASRSPFGTCVPPPPAGGVFPTRGALGKESSFAISV